MQEISAIDGPLTIEWRSGLRLIGLIPIWEFTNELAVDQAATFSFYVDFSCFTSCRAFLHHKRVAEIMKLLEIDWPLNVSQGRTLRR